MITEFLILNVEPIQNLIRLLFSLDFYLFIFDNFLISKFQSPQYPGKKDRMVTINGNMIELTGSFTVEDVHALVVRRHERRNGIHVYDGKALTEKFKHYMTSKQLIGMSWM